MSLQILNPVRLVQIGLSFLIRDPATGKAVTLNNRGLAALVEAGKLPQNAIYVPYEHVPKHLVEDIRYRLPSRSIDITRNKDGTGLVKTIGKFL